MLHDDYEKHLRLSDTDVAGPQSLSNRTGRKKDWECWVVGVIVWLLLVCVYISCLCVSVHLSNSLSRGVYLCRD